MANTKGKYELMTVYSLAGGEEAATALVTKFKEFIEKNAEEVEVDEWGKRKLAYPINDENEGYYTVYTFTAERTFPKELNRVLNITDGVLRSLVTVRED